MGLSQNTKMRVEAGRAETCIFPVCTDTGCACWFLQSQFLRPRTALFLRHKLESTRRRYGEFQNVFLSDEECTRLETAYPGKAAEYIERLSRYMASNDRHYANHYATIKKWLDEDSKGRSAKNY